MMYVVHLDFYYGLPFHETLGIFSATEQYYPAKHTKPEPIGEKHFVKHILNMHKGNWEDAARYFLGKYPVKGCAWMGYESDNPNILEVWNEIQEKMDVIRAEHKDAYDKAKQKNAAKELAEKARLVPLMARLEVARYSQVYEESLEQTFDKFLRKRTELSDEQKEIVRTSALKRLIQHGQSRLNDYLTFQGENVLNKQETDKHGFKSAHEIYFTAFGKNRHIIFKTLEEEAEILLMTEELLGR